MTMFALGFCNALQNGEFNALSNALDGIKHTFGVNDFAIGAAAFVGSVGGSWGAVPIAALCHRYKRVHVLGGMFVAWSIFMLLAGSVPIAVVGMTGFAIFSFFRLLIGWMEATDPAAYPLIADYYPHHERASRIGVFQGLAGIGTVLGIGLSGPIVDSVGWRGALYMWVPIGLAGAWLISAQPEPPRGGQDAGFEPELKAMEAEADETALLPAGHGDLEPDVVRTHVEIVEQMDEIVFPDPATVSRWEVIRAVLRLRTWLLTAIAMGIAQMMQTALMFWSLSYMKRTYHLSASQASLRTLALGPPGMLGVFLGGYIADRYVRRGMLRARVWVAGAAYSAAGIACALAFSTTVQLLALAFLALAAFMIAAALGPSFAMLYDVTPAPLRGEGAALSDILMWPSALGTAIVGGLSALTGSLRIALGLASPLLVVGGATLLLLGKSSPPSWAGPGYLRAVEQVVVDAKRRLHDS
ncbi:MAG: transporter [Acidimicrobiales bacterium]|nr:transporter [Acidimicrobiales bacterium]